MSSYSFLGHTRTWTPREHDENRGFHVTAQGKKAALCKSTPMTNGQHEVDKWNIKRIILLLRLYGAHRCLWDVNDGDYRSRELRKAALVDIAAAMGGSESQVTQDQIVQKINVLRATYRYEKKRIKQRIRSGTGARTKLKWFVLADSFLRHVPKAEKFRRNTAGDSDSDLENAVVFTIDPETIIPFDEEQHMYTHNNRSHEFQCDDDVGEPLDFQNEFTNESLMAVKPEESCVANTNWTSKESLEFVKLLRYQPTLWPTASGCSLQYDHSSDTSTMEAIQHIAHVMQMPVARIERRVHAFRRVWHNEQAKLQQNPHCNKPAYVWWHIAEQFVPITTTSTQCGINMLQQPKRYEHFVDANEPPPPTPTPIKIYQVATATNQMCNEITNVQHLNDVATSAMPIEWNENIDNDHVADGATPTKLIWNGLEDDLLDGKWSLKHSVKFLRLYGAHRCLWDLNDVDFRSRELRNAAIEDMAAAMGHGLTPDYVAKKIKIFRITYMQHRKRMLAAIKQGKHAEIQLRWFPLADSFLRPHIGLRCIKEHEREMPQYDFQYVYANLNLIDPALLTDFRGKGTQNTIAIGAVEHFAVPPSLATSAATTTSDGMSVATESSEALSKAIT